MDKSAVSIVETVLPGVGLRYELTTRAGVPIGLLVNRAGGAEVAVYDPRDPDRTRFSVRLDAEEAEAIAQLLSGASMVHRVESVSRLPGLATERVAVLPGSPFDGRPLGDTKARTRTGCSVVAIVRDPGVVVSPGPEEVLQGGDDLVVVGTQESIGALADILRTGD